MKSVSNKLLFVTILYTVSLIFACFSINALYNTLTPVHDIMSIDRQFVGRDFLYFYAAAKSALAGQAHSLYLQYWNEGITASLIPELGADKLSFAWLYPPHYLLILLPLALLPYFISLGLWLSISIAFPAFILWRFWNVRGVLWLATALNINVFICMIMGQNALIFSALTGLGIALLKKRPAIAGICFALVSMKPHFAIFVLFALIIGKHWQALRYTIISTLFLMLASCLLFGWDIWLIAAGHYGHVQNIALSNSIGFFSSYSPYLALISLGFTSSYAWCGHLITASIAFYGFLQIWRMDAPSENKWLALAITMLLCSPYNLDYDAVWITLPVFAWLAAQFNKKIHIPAFMYVLFLLQIFAFAFISVSNLFPILLIISALIILFKLNTEKNV